MKAANLIRGHGADIFTSKVRQLGKIFHTVHLAIDATLNQTGKTVSNLESHLPYDAFRLYGIKRITELAQMTNETCVYSVEKTLRRDRTTFE